MNVVITASQKMGDENPIIYDMLKKRTNGNERHKFLVSWSNLLI